MALSSHVGNFTQPTTTNASFAVTGVGFTPKALILFATDNTTTGTSVNRAEYMGMATSTTNRCAVAAVMTSGTETSDRSHTNAACFLVNNTSGTSIVIADFVSFDADGFTLNFSTVDATARLIGYIALGGADLTNAFIKQYLPAASNTAQAFTGVGFKPDAMFTISSNVATAPPANNTSACDILISFATATDQRVLSNVAHNSTESNLLQKVLAKSSEAGSLTEVASFTSFDADGFTLTFTTSSSVKYNYALCLKGGNYAVGVFNQSTSTGNQSVTGLGFQPSGVALMSINDTTQTALVTTQARMSFGAASSSTSRASMWIGGGKAGTMDNNFDTGKILNMITEGATPTLNTAADFVSLDSGGFTVNNTTTDATTREIAYMAFGPGVVAGTAVKMQAIRGWSFPV